MPHALTQNWWLLALRGLVAIAFGVLTFIWPGLTLLYLVILFGIYVLMDGIFNIAAALHRSSGGDHRWVLALEGLVGIAAGILTFAWPGITALVLLYVIAFWAIFTGVLEIVAGVRLRKRIPNEWFLVLMGVLSILFGGFILAAPGAGALAITIWIGAYALVFGVLLLGLALRLRSHGRHMMNHTGHPGTPLPHTP